MRSRLFIFAIAAIVAVPFSALDVAAFAPWQSPQNLIIPEGTIIQLSLRESVSSKLSDVGDEVRAVVKKNVEVNGTTLLRQGTEVIGRVTFAQSAKRPLKGGRLHITFDRVRLDSGIERKLVAVVQSASDFARDEKIPAKSEGTLKGGKSGGDVLRNASLGAGLGGAAATIVILAGHNDGGGYGFGRIGGGTAAGAAGALGGGLIAGVLLSKGKEVRLDSGTVVRLRLERALSVE